MQSSNQSPLRFSLASLFVAMLILSAFLAVYHALGDRVIPVWWIMGIMLVLGYSVWRKQYEWAIPTSFLLLFTCCCAGMYEPSRHGDSWTSYCRNNLKLLGLVAWNYHDIHRHFPSPQGTAGSGTPPHSWRVALLPYIEQPALHAQYNFQQAWDGPSNAPLSKTEMREYRCPGEDSTQHNESSYFAITGHDTCFPPDQNVSQHDIPDGVSNTLLYVERHRSGIAWTEPRDLDAATMAWQVNAPQGEAISSAHGRAYVRYFDGSRRYTRGPNGANVLLADGSTQFVTNDIDPVVLKQLANRRDGQPKNDFDW